MRDGVRLSADIYFPAAGPEGGPYPTVLGRTPYDNQNPAYVEMANHLSEHGYVVVLQDVRGRHDSLGEWVPFRLEGPDGCDTVEWAASQPWSTGKVGTFGGSYGGWYQWALAREHPPHLVTMISTAAGGKWFEEIPYHNGCVLLVLLGWLNLVGGHSMQKPEIIKDWKDVFWHLPLRTLDERVGRRMPVWQEWIDHPTLDDYWKEVRLDNDFAGIAVPALHITGWYDGDQPGALYFHDGMVASSPRAQDQYLLIGPWDHGGTRHPRQELGGVDFGKEAVEDIIGVHCAWFDHWLKGDGKGEPPRARVRLFMTGTNTWIDTTAWPPPGVSTTTLYLHSGGSANTLAGDGTLSADVPGDTEPADTYVYDPANPVPSVIDPSFYVADAVETPLDHRFKHRRDDVLVYTGPAQREAITITGYPIVRLFAASDAPDTDWHVELHDISDTGASMILTDGRLRARFRESLEREQLLEPNKVYEFTIRLGAVGHVLRPGHCIRLTVTSSDFPTWDRNPNTGHRLGEDAELRVATNQICHQSGQASSLELPVAPPSLIA
jgi:putative CocE/NonD family hydrolase